jgi:hypothetical protein
MLGNRETKTNTDQLRLEGSGHLKAPYQMGPYRVFGWRAAGAEQSQQTQTNYI